MLRGLRNAGKSWIGKAITVILFSLLIMSFAIWGTQGMLRGAAPTAVATIGKTSIQMLDFRAAFESQVKQLRRPPARPLTNEQGRELGIDRVVFERLTTDALLNESVRTMRLGASTDQVLGRLVNEPALSRNGQFDRTLFDAYLRNTNMTEYEFFRQQQANIPREQLIVAMAADFSPSQVSTALFHRLNFERRKAEYYTITVPDTDIPTPTDAALQDFYEKHRSEYRAPEYRTINAVVVDPKVIVPPESVSDADARLRYDALLARIQGPNIRTFQQLVFNSPEQAEAAEKRLKDGASFETVATEFSSSSTITKVGPVKKEAIVDPAIAEAVFSLTDGGTSGPLKLATGTVIVHLPAPDKFEAIAPMIKAEIAFDRAREAIEKVHSEIEDLRAEGRTVEEIVKEKNLPLTTLSEVDSTGRDKSGADQISPLGEDGQTLLKSALSSSQGATDSDTLQTKSGGYIWFDVTAVQPEREKTFDEVKSQVADAWKAEERANRLKDKAETLTERLSKGETPESMASELGSIPTLATELARDQAKGDLSVEAVKRIFTTPVDRYAHVANGDGRILFKVTAATVQPYDPKSAEAAQLKSYFEQAETAEILVQYVAWLRKGAKVEVNQQLYNQAVGKEM